jgi:hypothetical protein
LLKALGELRYLRDRLHGAGAAHDTAAPSAAASISESSAALETDGEKLPDNLMPAGRYNAKRLDDRLAATR